jgi:hypothetical protein
MNQGNKQRACWKNPNDEGAWWRHEKINCEEQRDDKFK